MSLVSDFSGVGIKKQLEEIRSAGALAFNFERKDQAAMRLVDFLVLSFEARTQLDMVCESSSGSYVLNVFTHLLSDGPF